MFTQGDKRGEGQYVRMVDGEGKRGGVVLLLNDWSDRGKLKDLLKGGGDVFVIFC